MRMVVLRSAPTVIGNKSKPPRPILRSRCPTDADAIFSTMADPDNPPSIVLLKALSFSLAGRMRAEWHTHIGVRDSLIYGLLAEEW